jgi:hypothetical protein
MDARDSFASHAFFIITPLIPSSNQIKVEIQSYSGYVTISTEEERGYNLRPDHTCWIDW